MKKTLTFAIFGNEYQTRKSTAAQKLLSILSERKAVVHIERRFCRFLSDVQQLAVEGCHVFDTLDFDVDYVISMGGDGTFLKAASMVGPRCVPIVGINTGRLGYLADVSPTEMEKAIGMIYKGNFIVERHAVIEVEA